MQDKNAVLARLDDRSREVFRVLVDHFIHTKNAAGSQTVVAKLASRLSPATVRHVMARLQEEGLLYAPHRSAGRLPTDFGLRLFVEGLMEVGPLDTALKRSIEGAMHSHDSGDGGENIHGLLERASGVVSGVAHCTGLVMAPKRNVRVKHIEFVLLQKTQVLVVLVAEDGSVENRLIDVPAGFTHASLIEAGNYLNARLIGKTLNEASALVQQEIDEQRSQLTALSERLVSMGLLYGRETVATA